MVKRSVWLIAVTAALLIAANATTPVASASFSGGGAASYADRWWNSYNTDYKNYGPDNDCTNYVSQCLEAGGLSQTSSWYNNWSRTPWDIASTEWANADAFFNYFKNHSRYKRVYIGTYDYFDGGHPAPTRNLQGWGRGGVVSFDFNTASNAEKRTGYPFVEHNSICVASPGNAVKDANDSSSWSNMPWKGDLTDNHSVPQRHRAWTRGDKYTASWLARQRWQYYVWTLPSTAH